MNTPVVCNGGFAYEVHDNWLRPPTGWDLRQIVGVAVDSKDRVYLFSRSDHPLTIFDRDGEFLGSWGDGEFVRPHGIFIGPDDSVYCTDDFGYCVKKFSPTGELLLTLGTPGEASDTGVENCDYRTMKQPAGPFNLPTNVALAPDGDIYVTDGYGNARVHRFNVAGEFIESWGQPGDGPGQFHVPHGVRYGPDELLYVSDRENRRVQRFTPEGRFVDAWTDLARPCEVVFDDDGHAYIVEVGFQIGLFPKHNPQFADGPGGRLTIADATGRVLAQFGGGEDPQQAGDFYGPHDIAIDSRGDLYIGEIRPGAGAFGEVLSDEDRAKLDAPILQKFVRV